MVIMEPVQSAGGCFTPPPGYFQGVREICDRYQILLCADEVINGFGRLGAWFGSELYDIRPDLLTCAKGLSSAYASIGAVVAADHIIEPFLGEKDMYAHGITFGGHPVQAAIALKNLEIMKREKLVERVRDNESAMHSTLSSCSTCRSSATSAARATSGRSSSSRTRRRKRVLGRGVGDAAARVPLAAALREGADLPVGRPRRPGRPVLAAADRRASRVRRDHGILGEALTAAWEKIV